MSDNTVVDGDKYADDYQAKLSESVGDGGGCAETWKALSEERSENDEPSFTRRKLVSAVGVAALGFGFTSGSTTAQPTHEVATSDDHPQFDVLRVDDKTKRAQIRQQAFSSTSVEKIWQEFRSEGWEAQEDEVHIDKTVAEDGEVTQYTLALPFATSQSHDDASIIWTNNPDIEIKGVHAVTGQSKVTLTRYTLVDGDVVTSQASVSREDLQKMKKELQEAGVSTDGITTMGFPLCAWNTTCIGKFAATAAGMISCCGTCSSLIGTAASAGTACVCCVLSGIGFVSVGCNVCK